MLNQSPTFREELFALLYRFGMPRTAEGFTLTCVEHGAPISLRVTFAPEFEGEGNAPDASTAGLLMRLVKVSEEAVASGRRLDV